MADFEVPAGTVVLETALDFHELDRQVKQQLPKKGKAAGEAVGKSFRRGFDAAMGDDAGKKVEKSLEGAEKGSRRAREAFEETGAGAADMGEAMEGASESAGGLALLAGSRLVKGLRGLTGWVGRTTSSFLTLSGVGVRELGSGLSQMGRELAESDSRLRSLGKAAEVTGGAIESLGGIMISVASAITGAKVAVAALAATMITMAKRAEDRFRPAWNRVLTLIPEGTEGIRDLRHEVSELAADLGIEAPKALDTLYQVLSAMPELVEEPARALEVLRVALEVAATGFADGATAAEAITAVLNAFELEAEDARRVSDKLFAAQDQGVLTFQDVASEIGKVSDLTNVLGGQFEELLAIVATITPTGQSVSDVFTQLRAVIRSFVDPSDEAARAAEAMGVDLSAAAIESKGLLGAITDLIETTEGSPEAISQLIPRAEAQTLLISLSTKLEGLEERYENIGNVSDSTRDKLDQMDDSMERQQERAREMFQHDLRLWGEAYERLGTKGLAAFNDLHAAMQELLDPIEDMKAAPGEIADAYEETFHERIPRAISSTLRAMANLPPLPPREGEGLRGETDPRRQRSAAGMFGERETPEAGAGFTGALPSPDSPARAVTEGLREIQAAREASAMLEFMDTGDVERYEAALRAIQFEINDLVQAEADRLQQFGVARSELQPLLNLYDREAEKYRNLKLELDPLKDATEEFFRIMSELPDVVGPDVEGFQEGAGGMLEVDPSRAQKLGELQRFTEELSSSQMDAGEAALAVRERMDDLGLSYEDLNTAIRMNIRALGLDALGLATVGFEVEGLDEETQELVDTLDDIEGTARGILSVADAMGVLDEDTRQALQSVIDLASGIKDIATGNVVGGAFQVAGGLAGAVSSMLGPGEREKVVAENTVALRNLRENLETLVAAVSALPGRLLAVGERLDELVQEIPEGFGPLPEGALPEDRPFGTEDSDLFGEPEATGGEVDRFLKRLGISFSDLQVIAAETGISIENITKAIEEGEAPADAVRQEFLDLNEAMKELDLQKLTETVEGLQRMIEASFEIFDIDDPAEQLEVYRDFFLRFTNLPKELVAEAEGFDLDTAEGRAAFEAWLQEIFRMVREGELPAEFLGDMSVDEFISSITRMERLVDQAAREQEEGTSRSFQIFRGVSELQAHQLLGKADTRNVLLRFMWDELIAIRSGMGFEAPTQGPTLLPPGPTVEPHEGMTNPPEPRAPRAPSDPGTLSLNVDSTVNVEAGAGEDAARLARRVSEEISRSVPRDLLRKLKEEMAEDYLSEQRSLGRVRKV